MGSREVTWIGGLILEASDDGCSTCNSDVNPILGGDKETSINTFNNGFLSKTS